MNKLKIKIDGYQNPFLRNIERLEEEFVSLGHEIVKEEPDLLVNINGLFSETENFYKKSKKKAVRIYNLLDCNNKTPGFYDECKKHLEECEIATTISNVARKQIEEKLKLKRKLSIIGFPIQPITDLKFNPKTIEFCTVGRIQDGYKRFQLIGRVLDMLGISRDAFVTVGPDYPSFGVYGGSLKSEELNAFYNSAKFVFCLSEYEFLYLPLIEACIPRGTYPICCNDNPIIKELGLSFISCDPTPKAIATKINDIKCNPEKYDEFLDSVRPKLMEKYSIKAFAENILELHDLYIEMKEREQYYLGMGEPS